ncbi:porin [Polynucleobacter paneuropaeus]|nr:porin [Polynucleobacter paneuropaeus]
MKKSLLAVAALGAFASAAQAQSSVTVYGVLDVGYVGGNTRVANQGTATASTVSGTGVTNSNYSSFTDGAESTSRLGFKGTEDLGGGMSAFFTVETALTPDLQNAISSSTGTANRQSFAGLKKNGIGQFAFGTQYTTIHNAVAASDPGMQNNMMGNVIYDKFSGIGANQGNAAGSTAQASGTNVGTYNLSGMQNNTSYTVRANNMLSVNSDTFAGFQGNAFYVLSSANTNQTAPTTGTTGSGSGGSTSHTAWGLGANYTWQKLFVTANYQNFTDKTPYTINTTTGAYASGTPVMNGWGGTSVQGTNARDNQQYYAATYDFGILKAYVQYVNRKTMDANNSNMYVARTAQQIGVRSFITPTVEAWASTGTGKYTVSTSQNGNSFVSLPAGVFAAGASNAATFGGFQLGSNYWLSKRTNLYAIYGQQRQSNQIYFSGNPTSYNMNNYALGMRHTF